MSKLVSPLIAVIAFTAVASQAKAQASEQLDAMQAMRFFVIAQNKTLADGPYAKDKNAYFHMRLGAAFNFLDPGPAQNPVMTNPGLFSLQAGSALAAKALDCKHYSFGLKLVPGDEKNDYSNLKNQVFKKFHLSLFGSDTSLGKLPALPISVRVMDTFTNVADQAAAVVTARQAGKSLSSMPQAAFLKTLPDYLVSGRISGNIPQSVAKTVQKDGNSIRKFLNYKPDALKAFANTVSDFASLTFKKAEETYKKKISLRLRDRNILVAGL